MVTDILLGIVKQLIDINVIGSAVMNGGRMLSAIIITCCLYQMDLRRCINISDIPHHQVSKLLYLLSIKPDVQHRKCEDWEYFASFIPESYRMFASEAVLAFIKHLSSAGFSQPYWLFAIPVMHFLKSASEPFQDIELDFRNIKWNDETIGLHETMRKRTFRQTSQ